MGKSDEELEQGDPLGDEPVEPEEIEEESTEEEVGETADEETAEESSDEAPEPGDVDAWTLLKEQDPDGYELALDALEALEKAQVEEEVKAKEKEAEPEPDPETDDFEATEQAFALEQETVKYEDWAEGHGKNAAALHSQFSEIKAELDRYKDQYPDDYSSQPGYAALAKQATEIADKHDAALDQKERCEARSKAIARAQREASKIKGIEGYAKDYYDLMVKGEITPGMGAKERRDVVLAYRAANGKVPRAKAAGGKASSKEEKDERRKRLLKDLKRVKPSKAGGKSSGAGSPTGTKKDTAGMDPEMVAAMNVEI